MTKSGQKRVLIIQEDAATKDLFVGLLKARDPDVVIHWATSTGGIETLPENCISADGSARCLTCYDIVIASFALMGSLTGIDLWNLGQKYCPDTKFVLLSQTDVGDLLPAWEPGSKDAPILLSQPFSLDAARAVIAPLIP